MVSLKLKPSIKYTSEEAGVANSLSAIYGL
jgi:hypothetical protein